MDIPKFNTAPFSGKTVLVAPLDWGLGHANRCIPIIYALLKRKNTVIIAATGARKAILAAAFPAIRIVDLPDYEVRLSVFPGRLNPGLFLQLPRLWSVVKRERKWLADFCRAEPIDLVISDNRYGLYHDSVHSVFITHQLFIFSGLGTVIDRWLMRIHFRLIARFRECWVPDNADAALSVAGRLSHPPQSAPFPVTYLGLLSRFIGEEVRNDAAGNDASYNDGSGNPYAKRDLLVILSGPEPQRSATENLILKQVKNWNGTALLVRGLPGPTTNASMELLSDAQNSRLLIVSHLPVADMREAILTAGTIVCRSGYSSLMDLIALGRTAWLIPTPGQPEQAYLGAYMKEKGWMNCAAESDFSLNEVAQQKSSSRSAAAAALPSKENMFSAGELPGLTLR